MRDFEWDDDTIVLLNLSVFIASVCAHQNMDFSFMG